MDKPLISVIIPVYNAAGYLQRSLDSVSLQTYRELEIITVDDGSKDESLSILESYAAQDHRFRVIHKENGGSSSARNAGLKAAQGDYVGFIDADDYIESDMYENLLGAFDEDADADVTQILSCEEDETGKTVKAFGEGFDASESFSGRDFFRTLLLHTGDSSFCTKLFRRDFFEGFSFSEGRLNEDFELLVKMSEKMRSLHVCRKPGYHIILRSQSNTRGDYNQSFYENVMENAERMLSLTAQKYPDLKNEAIHFYLMQAMWFLLHIPSGEMRDDNRLYVSVTKRVRQYRSSIKKDPYLQPKAKRNLMILAYLPARSVKKMHELIKGRS